MIHNKRLLCNYENLLRGDSAIALSMLKRPTAMNEEKQRSHKWRRGKIKIILNQNVLNENIILFLIILLYYCHYTF